jgi:hypothetical protein
MREPLSKSLPMSPARFTLRVISSRSRFALLPVVAMCNICLQQYLKISAQARKTRSRGQTLCATRCGLDAPVLAFREFLNHFLIESRNIVGFSAGDEPVIVNDLAIHPFGAGIDQVGLEGRPGGHGASAHCSRFDQRPSIRTQTVTTGCSPAIISLICIIHLLRIKIGKSDAIETQIRVRDRMHYVLRICGTLLWHSSGYFNSPS